MKEAELPGKNADIQKSRIRSRYQGVDPKLLEVIPAKRRIESGKKHPSLTTILLIAGALDTTVDDLLADVLKKDTSTMMKDAGQQRCN